MINVDIWLKDHETFLNRRKNCTLSQFPRLLITNFSRLIMIKKIILWRTDILAEV